MRTRVYRSSLDAQPAAVGAGSSEQLLEGLDLEQEQAQIEEHVDDLGAGDEITAPETLERLVDHLGELLLVHGTTSRVNNLSAPGFVPGSRVFRDGCHGRSLAPDR